jgi:hypothetical protein
MFYEPSTGREFASAYDFKLAYKNTSFGDLDTEAERNAAGLFTLADMSPAFNPLTHTLAPAGVAQQPDGSWARAFAVAPLPLEDARANLLQAVTDLRWQKETGGITRDGIVVGTTIDDQNRITSVIANAQAAGVTSVDFKAQSGWVTLTLAQIQGIAAAIALHVQACFSAERAHCEAVQALVTLAALQAYDLSAGWPA